jgi:hypothetical protein
MDTNEIIVKINDLEDIVVVLPDGTQIIAGKAEQGEPEVIVTGYGRRK